MKTRIATGLAVLALVVAPAMKARGEENPNADKVTAERTKQLKDAVAKFTLTLTYFGPQDKPFYCVTLTVPVVYVLRSSPFNPIVQISQDEATKIIDALAKDGYVGRAKNVTLKEMKQPAGPTYLLTVYGPAELALWEELGWDLKMLARLDALRKALDGQAAKAMDLLLGRMSGLRAEWEKTDKQPAGGAAGADANVRPAATAEEFAKANPGYTERAGAFYEKEYLAKAVGQLAAEAELTAQQKESATALLRAYIYNWLDSCVAGGGRVTKADVAKHLATLDDAFSRALPKEQFALYKKWREDETGARNAMRFLMALPADGKEGATKTELQLPGSIKKIEGAFSGVFQFAALMEATDDATVESRNFTGLAMQKFKIVDVLVGLKPDVDEVKVKYIYANARERAVKKGERVVWFVWCLNRVELLGVKALPGTETNAKLVVETAKGLLRTPENNPETQPEKKPAE